MVRILEIEWLPFRIFKTIQITAAVGVTPPEPHLASYLIRKKGRHLLRVLGRDNTSSELGEY